MEALNQSENNSTEDEEVIVQLQFSKCWSIPKGSRKCFDSEKLRSTKGRTSKEEASKPPM